MQARNLMTRNVTTVEADDTISTVAKTLSEENISAAPVLEDGKLVGLVSEGDLLRRVEIGTAERKSSWWERLVAGNEPMEKAYIKSHALCVRDVMSKNVITVTEDTAVADIPAILEKHHIKRVPVMRGDTVVGIVSRANLIQRLAASSAAPLPPAIADDAGIRARFTGALAAEPWSRHLTNCNVTVNNGVVEFWGVYAEQAERDAMRVMAEGIAGVNRVDDHRVPRQTLNYV